MEEHKVAAVSAVVSDGRLMVSVTHSTVTHQETALLPVWHTPDGTGLEFSVSTRLQAESYRMRDAEITTAKEYRDRDLTAYIQEFMAHTPSHADPEGLPWNSWNLRVARLDLALVAADLVDDSEVVAPEFPQLLPHMPAPAASRVATRHPHLIKHLTQEALDTLPSELRESAGLL